MRPPPSTSPSRAPRKARRAAATPAAGWLCALALALLVQLPILAFLAAAGQRGGAMPSPAAIRRPMRVALVPAPKKEPKPVPEGTVVRVAPPEEEEKPREDARFLAEHVRRVEKEQKARERTAQRASRSKRRVEKPSKVQSPDSEDPRPTRLPERQTAEATPRTRQTPTEDRGSRAAGEQAEPTKQKLLFPDVPRAMNLGSVQTLTADGSPNDALLEVVDEGEETLLNTRRYRFVTFFHRVRERVEPFWSPNDALRRRDPTGRAFCCKDRLTYLRVSLDRTGRIVKLDVERPSGLPFLDQEAASAFRQAAVFPNPPAELFDEDTGLLEFRFGFLLEFRDQGFRTRWVPPKQL